MRKIQWRALGLVTAVGSVAALSLLSAAPAGAAPLPATSSAYGVQACLLAAAVPPATQCAAKVGPTPSAAYPTGPGTASVTNVKLPPLGTVGVVNVSASGNDLTGFSKATATTNNTALLLAAVAGAPAADAVDATVIKATCTATKSAATGSATFLGLTIGGKPVDLGPLGASKPNNVVLNLPGNGAPNLLKIVLNEQTKSAGAITVNAVHIFVGPIVKGKGSLGDLILSHVSCGPNAGTKAPKPTSAPPSPTVAPPNPANNVPADSIPTGVPAGGPPPTHGGSPVLPLTGLLSLMLVAGGVVAYRRRGTLDH